MNISKIFLFLFFFIVTPLVKAQTIVVTAQRQPDQGLIAASQQNSGPMIGGNLGGYGSAGMNDAMAARAAAEKQGCMLGIQGQYGTACNQEAKDIQSKDQKTCNIYAIGGAVIGAVGGVGLAALAFLSGPPGWAAVTLFAISGSATVGGAGANAYGTTSCAALAEDNFTKNIKICTNNVRNLQNAYCPK